MPVSCSKTWAEDLWLIIVWINIWQKCKTISMLNLLLEGVVLLNFLCFFKTVCSHTYKIIATSWGQMYSSVTVKLQLKLFWWWHCVQMTDKTCVSNVAWENYESNWISKNQTVISSSLKAWWCYILNRIFFVIVKLRLIANFTVNVQDTAECNIFLWKTI